MYVCNRDVFEWCVLLLRVFFFAVGHLNKGQVGITSTLVHYSEVALYWGLWFGSDACTQGTFVNTIEVQPHSLEIL